MALNVLCNTTASLHSEPALTPRDSSHSININHWQLTVSRFPLIGWSQNVLIFFYWRGTQKHTGGCCMWWCWMKRESYKEEFTVMIKICFLPMSPSVLDCGTYHFSVTAMFLLSSNTFPARVVNVIRKTIWPSVLSCVLFCLKFVSVYVLLRMWYKPRGPRGPRWVSVTERRFFKTQIPSGSWRFTGCFSDSSPGLVMCCLCASFHTDATKHVCLYDVCREVQ